MQTLPDLRCRECGEVKPDVTMRPHPFIHEVHDRIVHKPLCNDCVRLLILET